MLVIRFSFSHIRGGISRDPLGHIVLIVNNIVHKNLRR